MLGGEQHSGSEDGALREKIIALAHRVVTSNLFQDVMHVLHARRPLLCARLLRMGYLDQRARKQARAIFCRHAALPVDHPDARRVERLLSIDRRNTRRMKRIIARHGWPAQSDVGPKAARAAWLLVHHADHDHMFQRACLAHLRAAVGRGEASPRSLAYLTDKVLVAEGRPQIYGTQVFDTRQLDVLYRLSGKELMDAMGRLYSGSSSQPLQPLPIEDEANVDHRRAEVGLPPMRVYIAQINRRVTTEHAGLE
ncbi:MAG: hypothetical protein Kow00124_10710 [Anaerolineae bacterium]